MADESSDQEKTEEPTAHRIDESRKKGEVASSKELTSVLVLAASILTLALSIVYIYEEMTAFLDWILTLKAEQAFTEKGFKTLVYRSSTVMLKCAAPIFIVTASVGVISNLAQVGFLFSPEVLNWKPERINPIAGFKRLFSLRSLFEAVKGIFKFAIIMCIVYFFVSDELNSYQGFFHSDLVSSFFHGKDILIKLAIYIVIGLVVVALGDFAYQKFSYRKKLMMTKEEVKKESKEQDGNPEIKQRIRAIQREMSQKRMMADVPTADVIVTNPTHISVALKYDTLTMVSPQVVAKGKDNVALKIREMAQEHNIPLVENVPLARAMYKTVKIGEPVPRNLYKAVAEVLAFVYRLRRKRKENLLDGRNING